MENETLELAVKQVLTMPNQVICTFYEDNECVFCHQKYRYIPKPKGYEDVVINIGEWEICQIYGSWGVYISHNGRIIVHASCSSPMSKRKLKEWLESYANK